MDFNARFYSPLSGRFLSADTIVPGAGNPQALNRYMFVLGNPVKFTDPTGHMECDDNSNCGSAGGSVIPTSVRSVLPPEAIPYAISAYSKANYAAYKYAIAAWKTDALMYQHIPSAISFQISGFLSGSGIPGVGGTTQGSKSITYNWRSGELDIFTSGEAGGYAGLSSSGASIGDKAGFQVTKWASSNKALEGIYVSGEVDVLATGFGIYDNVSVGVDLTRLPDAIKAQDPRKAIYVDPVSGHQVFTVTGGAVLSIPPDPSLTVAVTGGYARRESVFNLDMKVFGLNFSPIPAYPGGATTNPFLADR